MTMESDVAGEAIKRFVFDGAFGCGDVRGGDGLIDGSRDLGRAADDPGNGEVLQLRGGGEVGERRVLDRGGTEDGAGAGELPIGQRDLAVQGCVQRAARDGSVIE